MILSQVKIVVINIFRFCYPLTTIFYLIFVLKIVTKIDFFLDYSPLIGDNKSRLLTMEICEKMKSKEYVPLFNSIT